MYAAGIGALCISSSVAAVMMNKKEDEVAVPAEQPEETIEKVEVEETGLAPEQPPPPPSEPAQTQLTTPDSMRSASMVHGNRGLNWKLQRCGDSMIDSSGGWCGKNTVGNWIQLDNGKVGSISAIVTQGRKDAAQWVKSFKVKYKDGSGSWWDIDGKTFPGNVDKSSKVITTFSKPVRARYIRIYPQTWNGHMSMRADMIAGDTNTNQSPSVGDLPYSGHSSSGNWANKPINGICGKGRLDSTQGWCAKKNTVGEWYQLGLTSPVNVSGMVMKGRHDANQWVTSTKFQYENEDGEFVDVDGGFIFDANYDRHSLMKIFFEKPVRTKAIRIYPQTWKGHMSGRFGILRGGSSSEGYRSRPVEKEIEAFSFY
jgi:hypothetical protein